jgi:hypothetical protein
MKSNLSHLFSELELDRNTIVEKLDTLDQKWLVFKPDSSAWSILQVCHHLIVSEELSLQYLNKKLQNDPDIPQAGLGSIIRSFLLNFALYLPIRYSAPSRVSKFPENLEWVDLKKRWENVREGMKTILDNIPEKYVKKLVYKHPSIGRLTLKQMLSFFRTHINRHEKQINRLILSSTKRNRSN